MKYIYLMLIILQIHIHIYMFNRNTLQLYFWHTKAVYLMPAKLEHLILYLMHFPFGEVGLKSN